MSALDSDYESYPAHTRIPDDELLGLYIELTMNGEYDLLPYEEEWRDRGPLLQFYGYQLRKRYDVDWRPSWEDTDINPFFCEDSIDTSTPNVIDAVRIDDDLSVAIKATLGWTREAQIAFLFTDGNAIEEPRNHCVPILDTFIEGDIVYIVMPLLRAFNDPPFVAVAEVVDFVDQVVQGIEYMHEQNVAHRDITASNIMMDASQLYPEGFHPVRQNLSRNGLAEVVGLMRMHAPVRYYLIDFDAAIAFEKGTPSRDKYAEGKAGCDEDVPEFKVNSPYDPFKVDIFQFGNLLRKEFLQKYTGVEFLSPLVKEMTQMRPSDRPNAKTVRLRFNTIRNRLTQSQLRAHLSLKDSTDPFRQHLLSLGIDTLLESDPDDSPEHSSSEAPTTVTSTRSHDSYWSGAQSIDSSVTSQESVEQNAPQGPFSMITNMFSRPKSPVRADSQGFAIPWRPTNPRSPSPQLPPQPVPVPKDSARNGRSPSPGRPKTGKFPWRRDSSPDSMAASPVLAVVNQFLAPESSLYADTYDTTPYRSGPDAKERYGWDHGITSPPPAAPTKGSVAPTPAPAQAPPPAPAKSGPNVLGRNRRNTVNSPPPPTVSKPAPAAKATTPTSIFGEWDNPETYFERPAPYSSNAKQAKSTATLPTFFNPTNQSAWDEPAVNGRYDMPEIEVVPEEQTHWSEAAIRAMNGGPPAKSMSTKPMESVFEKKSKTIKSPTATLSKKSAAAEPVTSTTDGSMLSMLRNNVASVVRPSIANITNRKSTIAVEDGTPFNTPPKSIERLPSPPPVSPPAAKTKKTKSKKGSISEMPKEPEKEDVKAEKTKLKKDAPKAASPVLDDEPTMPGAFSTVEPIKMPRRGSGASNTSRPSSPFSIVRGHRSNSVSKKDGPTIFKPSTAKPTSFKSSGFSWGSKSKTSPPVEDAASVEPMSFASTFSKGDWDTNGMFGKVGSMQSATSPQSENVGSDYDAVSSPVTTPPLKSGWKSKTSYFPEAKASSPKEVEEDLAHLKAQMQATPKASLYLDSFSKATPSFGFGGFSTTDMNSPDFWSNQAAQLLAGDPEDVEHTFVPEPTPVSTKRGAKPTSEAPKFADVVEPMSFPVKGKAKKMTATKAPTKPVFGVDSAAPSPSTFEANDSWAFGSTKKDDRFGASTGMGNWFSNAYEDAEAEGDEMFAPVAEPEPEPASSPVEDSWFSQPKPKGRKGAKIVPPAAPAVVSKPIGGKKVPFSFEPAPTEDDDWFGPKPKGTKNASPVETKQTGEEDDWYSAPVRGKASSSAKRVQDSDHKSPAPAVASKTMTAASKWASFGMDDGSKANDGGDDLAAQLTTTLDKDGKDEGPSAEPENAVENEAPAKNTAKNNNNNNGAKNAKGKKKGKR